MKKLFLFIDELKDNISDFLINTLIITLAAVFISFAVYSISSYFDSMLYYVNPNTNNVVKIISLNSDSTYDDIFFDFDEFDYHFTSTLYSKVFSNDPTQGLFVLSEEFFNENLGLADGDLHDILADTSQGVNTISVLGSDLYENSNGTMANGTMYTVVKKWHNNAPYYFLSGIIAPTSAVIALDSAVNTSEFQISSRVIVGKINISFNEFCEKYQENLRDAGWIIVYFNGFETVANEYENAINMTVLGIVIFLTACIAIIINNYLSYERRKKTYEILITLGAHRKLFIFNSLMTRIVQLIFSLILSIIISLSAEWLLDAEIASARSIFIAFGIIGFLLAVGLIRYITFLRRTHAVPTV